MLFVGLVLKVWYNMRRTQGLEGTTTASAYQRILGLGGRGGIGVFLGSSGASAYRRILGQGGRGGDRRIGVSAYSGPVGWGSAWGVSAYSGSGGSVGGDWRIGVEPFSGRASGASAYRRILYQRIIVFGVWERRIGVSAYSGPGGRGAERDRRIGVWACHHWHHGGDRRIGVSAYSGPGRSGGVDRHILGLGGRGGWIGVSAYRNVGAAHRRIGVYILGLEGGQGRDRRIGVSAYSGPEGSVGGWGGDRRNGVSAYVGFLPLSACTLIHTHLFIHLPEYII